MFTYFMGWPIELIGPIVKVLEEAGVEDADDLATRLHVGVGTYKVVDAANRNRVLGTIKYPRNLLLEKPERCCFVVIPAGATVFCPSDKDQTNEVFRTVDFGVSYRGGQVVFATLAPLAVLRNVKGFVVDGGQNEPVC